MKASPLLLAAALGLGLGVLSANAQGMPSQLAHTCGPGSQKFSDDMLRQASPTAESQAADLAAARKAIAAAGKIREDALAGRDVEAPYGGVAFFSRNAAAATSPRTAELFRRAARDQLGREHFSAAIRRISWAADLSEPALGYAFRAMAQDSCGVDEDNTAWLKTALEAGGWFTISADGEEADKAAWALIQHADKDPAFQTRVLGVLEPLARKGETRPQNYALLFDRVAVAQKRPQRYGSQGRCTGAGVWTPFETEDPANLDQRRASMGLRPLAEYVKGISARSCGKAN